MTKELTPLENSINLTLVRIDTIDVILERLYKEREKITKEIHKLLKERVELEDQSRGF